jgi:hypothetical protein
MLFFFFFSVSKMSSTSKKGRAAEAAIIMAIIAFSVFLLLNLNSLAWPIGQTIGGLPSSGSTQVGSQPQAYGRLVVSISSRNFSVPSRENSPNPMTTALANDQISIKMQGSLSSFLIGSTNSDGLYEVSIPPNTYIVRISDPLLSNLTDTIVIESERTTHYDVILNETHYPTSSFDLIDSDSSNWFGGGWNHVFVQLPTNNSIPTGTLVRTSLNVFAVPCSELFSSSPSSGGSEVLDRGTCPTHNSSSAVNVANYTGTFVNVPVTVTGTSLGNDTQWLELQLSQFVNIQGVNGISLVTDQALFKVSITSD